MLGMENPVEIQSRDYWFKIVSMLEQNWALVDNDPDSPGVIVYFVHDLSGVFDRMRFKSYEIAKMSLRWNGFMQLENDKDAQDFLSPPPPPFWEAQHPNGPIYSSGRFWR